MAALTVEKTNVREVTRGVTRCRVKGATKILQGGMVAIDAAGYLVRATKVAGIFVIGIAKETVDNTAGADGAKLCDVRISGAASGPLYFKMATASSGGLVDFKKIGQTVYVEDDQTVTATAAGSSVAGVCVGVDTNDGLPLIRFPV